MRFQYSSAAQLVDKQGKKGASRNTYPMLAVPSRELWPFGSSSAAS